MYGSGQHPDGYAVSHTVSQKEISQGKEGGESCYPPLGGTLEPTSPKGLPSGICRYSAGNQYTEVTLPTGSDLFMENTININMSLVNISIPVSTSLGK